MTGPRVALTFDVEHPDRPPGRPDVAVRLVDQLEAKHIRASFFLQGRWATAYPDVARHIATSGHLVGNHSHAHANLSHFSRPGLVADIRAAEQAICESAGVDPRPWFRCPHGTHSHSAYLGPVLRELGYHDAHWNIIAEDWQPGVSAGAIAAAVIGGIAAHPDGAVVLLHSWPAALPAALARIVDYGVEHDCQFVTVAEMPPGPSWLKYIVAGPP